MAIEEKMDQLIAMMLRLEEKLDRSLGQVPGQRVEETVAAPALVVKPTKSMLEFKRAIEFANSMSRTHFLSAVRKQAPEIMERRKLEPGLSFVYTPNALKRIDEKISRYPAQFYKDLRTQTVQFGEALEKKRKRFWRGPSAGLPRRRQRVDEFPVIFTFET